MKTKCQCLLVGTDPFEAKTIVTRLDAAFLNKYKSNPDKIAVWKSASRVERAPKKAKVADEPATT
jgi:hypothetical protein